MEVDLNKINREMFIKFLKKNSIRHDIIQDRAVIPDFVFNQEERCSIINYFRFHDIFFWREGGIENVTLWENPGRIRDVLFEFSMLFPDSDYDSFASLESRGFILGGIFSYEYAKPLIAIRKHKKAHDRLPGLKHHYINWKNEKETIYLFKNDTGLKRSIFIDDILDSGRSLKACEEVLKMQNTGIAGAFYLADASPPDVKESFSFPVKSLLRLSDIRSVL